MMLSIKLHTLVDGFLQVAFFEYIGVPNWHKLRKFTIYESLESKLGFRNLIFFLELLFG